MSHPVLLKTGTGMRSECRGDLACPGSSAGFPDHSGIPQREYGGNEVCLCGLQQESIFCPRDWIPVCGRQQISGRLRERSEFAAAKPDDRLQRLVKYMEEYLRQPARGDSKEDAAAEASGAYGKEEPERRLQEAKERYGRYEAYRNYMEKNGLAQPSVTDADAKLMKNKNGFAISCNMQTAVGSETHMIRDCESANQVTDHGLLKRTLTKIRTDCPEDVINEAAD